MASTGVCTRSRVTWYNERTMIRAIAVILIVCPLAAGAQTRVVLDPPELVGQELSQRIVEIG